MMGEENIVKKIYGTILDLIYPEEGICFICDKYDGEVDEDHICPDCRKNLIFISGKTCDICGKPLEEEYIFGECPHCKRHPHYFSKSISILKYEGIVKEAIYRYKYGKKTYIYRVFGKLLVEGLLKSKIYVPDIDFVVPVPLHKSKYIKRGFNQAGLLGEYISHELGITLCTDHLIRGRKTKIQNKLHKLERIKNIKGAFEVKSQSRYKDKIVLLVDDIFTTGSTADECSKALLEAGAKEVFVICLATGKGN